MRENDLRQAMDSLRKNLFSVSTFLGSNTCFDLIAKNREKTLLIKAYDNIDSIRREQGEELKKLAQVLNASPIIIGRKTKVFALKNGTVYYRYGIPAVTAATFSGILEDRDPKARYFKGKYIVDMDFEGLRSRRNELELSLSELGEKVGLAAETLHRFEKGASTSLETAKRLEEELDTDFSLGVDVFRRPSPERPIDEVPDEKLLEKIRELGMKMAVFRHTPFRAYGTNEEGIFIGTGKGKSDIPKKALELKKASAIVKNDSIIVTKEYRYETLHGVPIIEERDLETISRLKDLKKMIEEREEQE